MESQHSLMVWSEGVAEGVAEDVWFEDVGEDVWFGGVAADVWFEGVGEGVGEDVAEDAWFVLRLFNLVCCMTGRGLRASRQLLLTR